MPTEAAPPTFASEAFALVGDVPSPKAWERQDDGSILIAGAHRLAIAPDGSIDLTTGRNSRSIPLMISTDIARMLSVNAISSVARPQFAAEDYYGVYCDWHKQRKLDRRLSPRARDILESSETPTFALPDAFGPQLPWEVGNVLNELAQAESASLQSRILLRSMGYARGGATGVAKLLNSFLWADIYDRAIASAAIMAYGQEATTAHYSEIAKQWAAIDTAGRARGLKSLLETHRPAFVLLPILQSNHLSTRCDPNEPRVAVSVLAPRPPEPTLVDIVEGARETLRLRGLRPSVWRMMLRMSVPQIAALRPLINAAFDDQASFLEEFSFVAASEKKTAPQRDSAIAMLNRLAELGAHDVPRSFLFSLAILGQGQRDAIIPVLRGILDGGRWARRRKCVRLQAMEIVRIADAWSAFATQGAQIATQADLTWAALLRHQEEWHDTVQDYVDADAIGLVWEPLVAEHATPAASARELCSWQELHDEGREMRHCVASYARACATGRSRIFSLRHASGRARSTLELQRTPVGKWRIAQHRAVRDVKPHPDLLRWSKTLLAAANREQTRINAETVRGMRLAA